eukprot:1612881-Pyramimonas_sp.AAC.1
MFAAGGRFSDNGETFEFPEDSKVVDIRRLRLMISDLHEKMLAEDADPKVSVGAALHSLFLSLFLRIFDSQMLCSVVPGRKCICAR